MKEVKSFGKGGEPIPNTVERFTEPNVEIPKEEEQKVSL